MLWSKYLQNIYAINNGFIHLYKNLQLDLFLNLEGLDQAANFQIQVSIHFPDLFPFPRLSFLHIVSTITNSFLSLNVKYCYYFSQYAHIWFGDKPNIFYFSNVSPVRKQR